MNELKHTPGPWKSIGYSIWTDSPNTTFCVAEATVSCSSNGYDENANAKLIAAAPEMLEALIMTYKDIDSDYQAIKKACKHVIESATGMKIEDVIKAL